jgi:hypothetical protein
MKNATRRSSGFSYSAIQHSARNVAGEDYDRAGYLMLPKGARFSFVILQTMLSYSL